MLACRRLPSASWISTSPSSASASSAVTISPGFQTKPEARRRCEWTETIAGVARATVCERADDSEARAVGSVMGNSVGFPQSGTSRRGAKLAGWAGSGVPAARNLRSTQPAQRRLRALAELDAIGARHPAQMGKAEVECNIDDPFVRPRGLQPRVELGEADVEQHVRDGGAEVTAEAKLQRADTGAGDPGEFGKIQRLGRPHLQIISRPLQRRRLGFSAAVEDIDGGAQAV